MTLLGRDHPGLSTDILFSELEIKALKASQHDSVTPLPIHWLPPR